MPALVLYYIKLAKTTIFILKFDEQKSEKAYEFWDKIEPTRQNYLS